MTTQAITLDEINDRLKELVLRKLAHGYLGADVEREIGNLTRTRRIMLDDDEYQFSFWHNGKTFWI